jgi:drug/metabolite transporter (DMT)-like permease
VGLRPTGRPEGGHDAVPLPEAPFPAAAPRDWIGPLYAVLGVLGFSVKAILIKLAYAWHAVDAVTLLTLRMLYAAPFFGVLAWWASRSSNAAPLAARDWRSLLWLGFIGYYLASLLDFLGLAYISAALERLVLFLYPTMVVLLSALLLGKPVTRRALFALLLSYVGILLVFGHDVRASGDPQAIWTGGALVFGSAFFYALYLVQAGAVISRLGALRFVSAAMLASTGFVIAQFLLTRSVARLAVPASIHALALAMAVFSTVLPTLLVAEAIRRIGANATSLVGSLGPVFTIGLGAVILNEPVHAIQLGGAALVLFGVMRVTDTRAARRAAAPQRRSADERTAGARRDPRGGPR